MKTAVLSLIIAILVAAFSVFQFEKYQHFSTETKSSIAEVNDKINEKTSAINIKLNHLEQEIATLKNNTNQMAKTAVLPQALSEYPQTVKEDLAMTTAYQLSRLADIQLKTTQDIQSASALLQEALENLKGLSTPKTAAIVEELNTQIDKLNGTKTPNITEIWEKLATLETQILTLPLRGDRNIQTKNSKGENSKIENPNADMKTSSSRTQSQSKNRKSKKTTEPEIGTAGSEKETAAGASSTAGVASSEEQTSGTQTEEKKGWQRALSKSWEDVKSIVKVQRHTKPLEPLFSNAEKQFAYENLTLLLEQARFAVLHRNQEIYQQSLQQAKTLMGTHFATEDANVDVFMKNLESLAHINLKPELPNLKPLLALFLEKRGG